MKKTTTISLAQQLFHIEEDAFLVLDAYISSIKAHFSGQQDMEEIISDIEFRIAEHFNAHEQSVITVEIAQSVIDTMGTVDQFTEPVNTKKITKKLYRDSDGQMIAGVASGLSYYLGLNRTLIRAIFVVSVFFGGFGIAVYVLAWIILPAAKTSVQKLEMRGEPANLRSVSEFVREQYTNTGTAVEQNAHRFFVRVSKVIKKLFGLGVVAGSFLFIVLISILAVVGLLKIPQELMMDQMITGITDTVYYFATIGFGYFAIVLPLIITLLWGVDLVWKKQILSKVSTLAFLSVWFVTILIASFCSIQLVSRYLKIEKTMIEQARIEYIEVREI